MKKSGCSLDPAVIGRHVVRDEIEDEAEAALAQSLPKTGERLVAAEVGVNVVVADGEGGPGNVGVPEVWENAVILGHPLRVRRRHPTRGLAGLPDAEEPDEVEPVARELVQLGVGHVVQRRGPAERLAQFRQPDARVDLEERGIAGRGHGDSLLAGGGGGWRGCECSTRIGAAAPIRRWTAAGGVRCGRLRLRPHVSDSSHACHHPRSTDVARRHRAAAGGRHSRSTTSTCSGSRSSAPSRRTPAASCRWSGSRSTRRSRKPAGAAGCWSVSRPSRRWTRRRAPPSRRFCGSRRCTRTSRSPTPTGRVVASALPFTGEVSVRDRVFFRRAVETRAFAVGVFYRNPISPRPGPRHGLPDPRRWRSGRAA